MRASNVIFAAGLSTLGALSASGCGAPPPREELPIDCTVTDDYGTPDLIPDAWFSATDGTGQVTCRSLENLLPDDMTHAEVAPQIGPLVVTPAERLLCAPRVPCSALNAIVPNPAPAALDRALCESSDPAESTFYVACGSLELMLPGDMNHDEVMAQIDPLMVHPPETVQCNPRVLCSAPTAIVPNPAPAALDRALCESTSQRRAVATIDGAAPLAEGERCNGTDAIHLTAARNNDWGCLFGNYQLAQTTSDKSAYDGIGLWAKAAPGTTKTILILLNDKYSVNVTGDDGQPVAGQESACVDEEGAGINLDLPDQNGQQGSGSTAVVGYVPSPNACGNAYQAQLTVTDRWQFYFMPWASFTQDPKPNRRLEGIDPSSLRGITIRAPKAAVLDMWLDDLGYYAKYE